MISKRASEFTSFIVMDVMARVEELERMGEHIIHMEAGEPEFLNSKHKLPQGSCKNILFHSAKDNR